MKNTLPGTVLVRWKANNTTHPYRRGLKGKVDLKAVEASVGGHYQPDWLPVLKIDTHQAAGDQKKSTTRSPVHFTVGDRVKIESSPEELRSKQMEQGGWHAMMIQVLMKEK